MWFQIVFAQIPSQIFCFLLLVGSDWAQVVVAASFAYSALLGWLDVPFINSC